MGTYKGMARENILIICHERGLNKAKGLLKALKNHNCILFVDKPPSHFKTYVNNSKQIIISHWFNIIDVTNKVKHIDVIYCCSENLLPIQSQLESFYNIKNISPFAAEVLSNKQLFDDYCRTIGLGNFVPKSITPKHFKELNIFDEDDSVFTKPDIGTGGNVFIDNVDYKQWKNINEFRGNEGVGKIFDLNREGICNQKFNNKPCRIMVQKLLTYKDEIISPFGFIANGHVNIISYLKLQKSNFDISKDLKVWFVEVNEVDSYIHEKIHFFLSTLIDNLNIKELFFVGPDFWMDDNIIGIDFNPRNGQFVNNLDDINNNNIFTSMLEDKLPQVSNKLLWASADLLPGKVKSCVIDTSIQKFLSQENTEISSGTVIPKNQSLQNKNFQVNYNIGGSNEMELLSKYQAINNTLQSSIVYN